MPTANETYFSGTAWNGSFFVPDVDQPPSAFLSAPKEHARAERNAEPPVALPFGSISVKLANVPPEPDWCWDGYLASGAVTLLAGKPKVGKSTLLFALLKALLGGEPFLSRATCRLGALLLSEERESTLKEKVDRWGIGDGVDLLMRHEAHGVAWEEIVAEAVERCHAEGLQVLVVDTFDKWAGLRGDAENSAGVVLTAVQPLLDAASTGLGVLVASHQRKGLGSFGEAVRGSNALVGAVDVVLELERKQSLDERARVLNSVSRFASTPDSLVLTLGDTGYEALGDLATAHADAETARLVDFLREREREAFSAEQLANETSIPAGTVRKRLNGAADVFRSGEGKRGDPHLFSFRTAKGQGAERNSEEGKSR
jgi:hypothetical protein